MFNVFNYDAKTVTGVNQTTGILQPADRHIGGSVVSSACDTRSVIRTFLGTTVVLLLLGALLSAQLKGGVLLIAWSRPSTARTDVPDLTIDDFTLEETGGPRRSNLSPTADQPISIGVILDTSGSMQSRSAPLSAPSTASSR
jgi:hypothetical protein